MNTEMSERIIPSSASTRLTHSKSAADQGHCARLSRKKPTQPPLRTCTSVNSTLNLNGTKDPTSYLNAVYTEESRAPTPTPTDSNTPRNKKHSKKLLAANNCDLLQFGLSDEIKEHLEDTPDIVDQQKSFEIFMSKLTDSEDDSGVVKQHFDELWDDQQKQKGRTQAVDHKKLNRQKSAVNRDISDILQFQELMPKSKGTGTDLDKQIYRELSKKLDPLTKDQRTLWQEQCENVRCGHWRKCQCFQRIKSVLEIYQKFIHQIPRWKRRNGLSCHVIDIKSQLSIDRDIGLKIDSIFQTEKYDRHCQHNDFLHVRIAHIAQMDHITRSLRKNEKLKCKFKGCEDAIRSRKRERIRYKDPDTRGLLSQIHAYFMQLRLCTFSIYLQFCNSPIFIINVHLNGTLECTHCTASVHTLQFVDKSL